MDSLVVGPNTLSQWYDLIKEAGKASVIQLPEDVESYLIFLLIHFTNHPEIAKSVLGQEYLEGLERELKMRQMLLKEVGDQCLLMSGLFPSRAQRKRVKISYFVRLGQNAYTTLSQNARKEAVFALYGALSERFVAMMDVLQTMRELHEAHLPRLNPLEAYELWNDTHSVHARRTLELYTKAEPVRDIIIKTKH